MGQLPGKATFQRCQPLPSSLNVACQVSEYGYSTITVHNSTTLEMKLFADESNDLHNFVLQRKYPRTA